MKNRHWHFPHYDINLHLDSHGIARWHNSCWCYSVLLCNCHWFLLNCRIWYGFRDINDQFASHLKRIITCKSASLILAGVNKKGYSEYFHGLQHMFRHLQRICGFFQILNILLRTFEKKVFHYCTRKNCSISFFAKLSFSVLILILLETLSGTKLCWKGHDIKSRLVWYRLY